MVEQLIDAHLEFLNHEFSQTNTIRSEERRVGKECRL